MTKTELEACIQAYGTDLFSFCRHITNSMQEAEDLYQDTFLTAIEKTAKIDSKNNPKSYLLSIAVRLWKNKKRKFAWRARIAATHSFSENQNETDPDPLHPSLEEQVIQKEEVRLVRQAVARLPKRLKFPVLLYYMEDMSTAEIAAILKIPAGTVKSRLYQARNALKKELEVILDEKFR